MKPLIHRKARNGRSRKYCIILIWCHLYYMNQRYVSTLYIEWQICTYIRKWYIQLLGIRTSISKNNIPFCRLNDREKKFTVTVTETPFEKAILFPLLLRNTATSKNHYMLAILHSIYLGIWKQHLWNMEPLYLSVLPTFPTSWQNEHFRV